MKQDLPGRAESFCMHCKGRCCNNAHPPVSGNCYQRRVTRGVPEDSIELRDYRAVRTRDDGPCIFCNGSRRSTHKIKPETCRAGPFTFDGNGDPTGIFLKYETICPVAWLLREIQGTYEHLFAPATQSITRLIANLTDGDMSAICRIEQPETKKGCRDTRRIP